jgi:molybdopterin molybdotransferase
MTQPADSSSKHDVRMRGFHSRTPVEDALAWIDANVDSLDCESVALADAHGRALASGIVSPINVPAFDRSAMDGFALKAAETVGAGDYNPLSFRIVGESMPGQPFEGTVGSGEAARIMTGAPIPDGVDAVVPAEYATIRDDSVEISTSVASLKHIGRTAEDVAAGSTVLEARHRLRPQDVGLIASLGRADVPVIRQPRVRIVVTGNELAEPGSERSPYQIFEANSHIIAGLVPRDGGILFEKVRCQDDRESILKAVTDPAADVVLISGGSSVGSEDHAPNIVRETGELPIHGVAMRPSSPAGIGRIGSTLIFLLPGNPVSCLCAYDFFAGRAIRRLAGLSPEWPHRTIKGTLKSKIVSQVGRVDYCRVRVIEDRIEPVALSGASILSSTTRANGFVIVPSALEGYASGTEVEVRLYS